MPAESDVKHPMPETRQEPKDLGFGTRVSEQSRQRFLNQDGSFNVLRRGLSPWQSLNPYHALLTVTWGRFYAMVIAYYIVSNILFACLYLACGRDALVGIQGDSPVDRFPGAFFFSVQTLATIGYGVIHPNGLAANLLVTIQAFIGLFSLALCTGILFSRFSRPVARIRFSRNAIIAPYYGKSAFEFRIINTLSNQLLEVEAKVFYSYNRLEAGKVNREFEELILERRQVTFFPLQWTIVHPINESSPLHGITQDALESADAEFIIMVHAIDETFSQSVHARSSYKYEEVVFHASFTNMYLPADGDRISVDVRLLDTIEPARLPPG